MSSKQPRLATESPPPPPPTAMVPASSVRLSPVLPNEVLDLILVKLPVKSLIRFSGVSRSCLNHFRSLKFRKYYESFWFRRSRLLILDPNSLCMSTLNLDTLDCIKPFYIQLDDYPLPRVVGAARGLVLLDSGLMLNPSTNRCCYIGHHDDYTGPVDEWHTYGLGYSSSRDDYFVLGADFKVIDTHMYLFSMAALSWSKIENPAFALSNALRSDKKHQYGLYDSEKLYWYWSGRGFVEFDLDSHLFSSITIDHSLFPSDSTLTAVHKVSSGHHVLMSTPGSAQVWRVDNLTGSAEWTLLQNLDHKDYDAVFGFLSDTTLVTRLSGSRLGVIRGELLSDHITTEFLSCLGTIFYECLVDSHGYCNSSPFFEDLEDIEAKWLNEKLSRKAIQKLIYDDIDVISDRLKSQMAMGRRKEANKRILECLQEAVKLLGEDQGLHQLQNQRNMQPSVVKEIMKVLARGFTSKEDLQKRALSCMLICKQELTSHGRRKKGLTDVNNEDLEGKRVFLRVDLDVPLNDNGSIADDTRIRDAVPTIKFLMNRGAKVILASHLGRPEGVMPKYSLEPLIPRLSELLGVQVKMANDCIGEEVENLVANLPGGVLLLENLRFHQEEEENDPDFSKKLASLADVYVNDAFCTAHETHASTVGVPKYLNPCVLGFLMEKQLQHLQCASSSHDSQFIAVIGGSKFSSKIRIIKSLLPKVDILLLGGGLIYTFYKAQGYSVGSSLVEEDKLEVAKAIIKEAEDRQVKLLLPTDVVIANKFAADAETKIVPASEIPDGWMGLDIGPKSIKTYETKLNWSDTILWIGPMGVYEFENFAAGTEGIAKALEQLLPCAYKTIFVTGEDTVAALKKLDLADKGFVIPSGGSASYEGKLLPGVLALNDY